MAWLVSFVVPAILLALLAVARPAAALAAPEPEPAVENLELFEVLGNAEEEDEGEEEAEEGEEGEEELGEGPYPEECLLRSADAQVFTEPGHNKVRLVIRYTAFEPVEVSVDYRLSGGKGSLNLGHTQRHLGNRGQLRLTTSLSDDELVKAHAAHSFTVDMHIPNTPSFCGHYFRSHLTKKRTSHQQVVWSQAS